ncbi:MAG: RsmB/NOP family class I SAM-dependent RNA methyltransferase [Candidatus Thorarchaeota archaeon]
MNNDGTLETCAMNLNLSIRAEAIEALDRFEQSSISMKALLREMQTSSADTTDTQIHMQSLSLSVIKFRNTIDYLVSRILGKRKLQSLTIQNRNILRLLIYETKWLDSDLEELLTFYPHVSIPNENKLRKVIALDLDTAFQHMPEINRLSLQYSHPTFLVKTLLDNMRRDEAIELLMANNQKRNYYIRPNRLHDETDSILSSLVDIELEQNPAIPEVSRVVRGIDSVIKSQYFQEGRILIQDMASVLTVKSLDPQPGDNIWDSCAAPGMKTQLIVEMTKGKGKIIATDVYNERVRTASERAHFLKANQIQWLQADATKPTILDADKILIDAPCTSTGILQVYPSFKWRLNKDTLFSLMTIQNKLLDGILKAYRDKPGTEIVFSTCSILPHEGESQIDSAMTRHNIELVEPYPYGTTGYPNFKCSKYVKRLFPHRHNTSGFFIAKLRVKQ